MDWLLFPALQQHLRTCLVRVFNDKSYEFKLDHSDEPVSGKHSQAMANIYMNDNSLVSIVAEVVCSDICQDERLRELANV